MSYEIDEQFLGYSKFIQEFMKQMEEQRLKPVLPKKPVLPRKPILKKEKPIPAPRKNRESYAGTIRNASDDIKAIEIASEERPLMKLKRSKTFATIDKPCSHNQEEDMAPTSDETQLLETNIKSFTRSEIHHLETLKIIIPVFMMALKKRFAIETNINMAAIECLVNRLIEGQTKFVLHDLNRAETYKEVLHCFRTNEDLFYTYRGFFLQKCSLFTFPITRPKTNFRTEVNLRQFLNDRITVYKKFILPVNLVPFNCYEDTEQVRGLLNWITMDVNENLEISKPLTIVQDTDRFFVRQEIPEAFFTQPSTVTKYGKYYLNNKFIVNMDFESSILWVHLFTKIMLFTKELKKSYLYKFHLNMDEIGFSPARNTKNMIEITQYGKKGPLLTYRLEGQSKDMDNWKRCIENILQEQQQELKR